MQANDAAFAQASPTRSKYPEPKEETASVSASGYMGAATKLIKNGEIGSFISKGIYPSTMHEGLTELQRKAESAFAYNLLDKVHQEALA